MKYIIKHYYTNPNEQNANCCQDILEIYFHNTDSTFNFADMTI